MPNRFFEKYPSPNNLFKPLNLDSAFNDTLRPIPFIWPYFLRGTVGFLTSPFTVSNTFFALQTAFYLATQGISSEMSAKICPIPLTSDRPIDHSSEKIIYFGGEDHPSLTEQKLHSILTEIVIPATSQSYEDENPHGDKAILDQQMKIVRSLTNDAQIKNSNASVKP